MKVALLNHSDVYGGAARAAFRLFESLLLKQTDVEYLVDFKTLNHDSIFCPHTLVAQKLLRLRMPLGSRLLKLEQPKEVLPRSANFFPSEWPFILQRRKYDVINLHWVGGEMLSIADVRKIKQPIVWTLHDMWPFCGDEHYTTHFRWRDGYNSANRPAADRGWDLSKQRWEAKVRNWSDSDITFVAPSNWMGALAKSSYIGKRHDCVVIPNAINTDVWKPTSDRTILRNIGVDLDRPVALFGSMGGTQIWQKGYDLLDDALVKIRLAIPDLQVVIFGEEGSQQQAKRPNTFYTGFLADDSALAEVYSSSDVMIVPSRMDNLPNTAVEASACGTPVVCFDVGGLSDIVENGKSGFVVPPFDVSELGNAVIELVSDRQKRMDFSGSARAHIQKNFSYTKVAGEYDRLYASKSKK